LVGIAAVFDGHNGAEASDMASKLLLDYFALHINFLLDATFSAMTRKLIGRFPTKGDHSVILHGVSRDEIMYLYNLDFQMQLSAFSFYFSFVYQVVIFASLQCPNFLAGFETHCHFILMILSTWIL